MAEQFTWIKPGEGTQFPLRWQTRVRAWWEGYDVSGLRAVVEKINGQANSTDDTASGMAAVQSADGEPLTRDGRPLWHADRIKVAEQLWGADFTSPGGVEHAAYLIKPFGITNKMSILDLSAGLGGVARHIGREYKAWVTGLEASKMLADIGNERSLKEGLGKHAPISNYDPSNFTLTRTFECIFAKEAFFTVSDKDALLAQLAKALKPGGQLLFTDYGIENVDLTDPHFVGWMSSEPIEPNLWTMERTIGALRENKLDVRINEDITHVQRKLILGAMDHFVRHIKDFRLDQETKLAVMDEIELWARRVAAFDAGLRVFRFYCMKH